MGSRVRRKYAPLDIVDVLEPDDDADAPNRCLGFKALILWGVGTHHAKYYCLGFLDIVGVRERCMFIFENTILNRLGSLTVNEALMHPNEAVRKVALQLSGYRPTQKGIVRSSGSLNDDYALD